MYAVVVDDDRAIATMVSTVLSLEGFDTWEVVEGDAAVETIRTLCPDVVVLDVMMPGVDGLTVLRSLRADPDPAVADIPVVITSARTSDQDVWEGWQRGADAYVPKPFDPQLLADEVQRVIRDRSPRPTR